VALHRETIHKKRHVRHITYKGSGLQNNKKNERLKISSAGFIYRLDRLKPRASQFRGPPAKLANYHKNPSKSTEFS
jgi:hypothetical protein